MHLGEWVGGTTPRFLSGTLDNFRLWSVLKSPFEIVSLFNSFVCNTTGLELEYRFNGNTLDSSGLNRNGIPINPVYVNSPIFTSKL